MLSPVFILIDEKYCFVSPHFFILLLLIQRNVTQLGCFITGKMLFYLGDIGCSLLILDIGINEGTMLFMASSQIYIIF